MNERIRELAESAGWAEHIRYKPTRMEIEKFAELIVGECVDICEDEDDGSIDTKSVRLAMIRIKKHFGVDE